ncbi:MAG TPA: hypothetical protein VFO57_08870, partial [Burkholderiales bacterium]|nr:hypothetical protein [Burkholderiales bacterium]
PPNSEELQQILFAGLSQFWQATAMHRRLDMLVEQYWAAKREKSKNPLLKYGEKFFSQHDEDGILLEICKRIRLTRGVFVEIGVGNGLENNSLILLMNGWQGVWLGAEPLAFDVPDSGPLLFQQAWVTRETCSALVTHGLTALGQGQPNVLSVDIDGNDLYVVEAIIASGISPDIVICEYNAKFPPPIRWSINYDPAHSWDGSDYQGVSLQLLVDVLGKYDYRLVACNVTGSNAFFVLNRHAGDFDDVPRSAAELFMAADYNWFFGRGHATSPRTIAGFLKPNGNEPE